MDLIFAKWIFTVAATLGSGTGLEWPVMPQAVISPARIVALQYQDHWTPLRQRYCLERGVYTVELRLGMLPIRRGSVDGSVWLAWDGGDETVLLLEFAAEAGVPTFQASSVSLAVESFRCFGLRYDSSGPARIDPAVSRTMLTIRG